MTTQNNDLSTAIALGMVAEGLLQKSHVGEYTRQDGTVVQAHEDSRQAKQASRAANAATKKAKSSGSAEDHDAAAAAHKEAFEAHKKAFESWKAHGGSNHLGEMNQHSRKRSGHEKAAKGEDPGPLLKSESTDEEPNNNSDELLKAVEGTQVVVDLLQKSHVKEHTRTSSTGAVSMVNEHDDKRPSAKAHTTAANQATDDANACRGSKQERNKKHIAAAHLHFAAEKAHREAGNTSAADQHDKLGRKHFEEVVW